MMLTRTVQGMSNMKYESKTLLTTSTITAALKRKRSENGTTAGDPDSNLTESDDDVVVRVPRPNVHLEIDNCLF